MLPKQFSAGWAWGEAGRLGEREGVQAAVYLNVHLQPGVLERRYKCNSFSTLDVVILAGLWRRRGKTGFRIVVWAFNVGRKWQGTAAASSSVGWEAVTIDFMHLPVLRERPAARKFAYVSGRMWCCSSWRFRQPRERELKREICLLMTWIP